MASIAVSASPGWAPTQSLWFRAPRPRAPFVPHAASRLPFRRVSSVRAQVAESISHGQSDVGAPAAPTFTVQLVKYLGTKYSLASIHNVRTKARAIVALMKEMGLSEPFTMEQHIYPQKELLDSIHDGLAVAVLSRYPREFFHPDAMDTWHVFLAFLHSLNFSPAMLVHGKPKLLAHTVRNPDAARCLFRWLRSLGCDAPSIVKIVMRFPNVLKLDVEEVLKPRFAALLSLEVSHDRAVQGIVRAPTILGVEPEYMQGRIEYLRGLGLTSVEIGHLVSLAPMTLLAGVESKLAPLAKFLQEDLGCTPEVMLTVLARGRLAHFSVSHLDACVRGWEELGYTRPELCLILTRYTNFLRLSPRGPHTRTKLAFLESAEGLGRSRAALVHYPQYLSYSLERRIGPRAAVMRSVKGRAITLSELGPADAVFCKKLGISQAQLDAAVEGWALSKWMDMLQGRTQPPPLPPLLRLDDKLERPGEGLAGAMDRLSLSAP
ncbi:hypothetical protein F751_0493 [Auxenochlorella protothecoides]|uniref:mTERF domain-containing protein 1, mitochondrial n=1 Tax=Auxenochlorella protothecoides TaxID=3075 RepID=A0A087SIB2_AUXPR|nr:hypothetical protein F751_0493 [Auxenochlorella protothecoides]KFM25466.1 hypothetical protein F751_0493 [Auxenochlorella protothecoides]